jgi:hypothetical protein
VTALSGTNLSALNTLTRTNSPFNRLSGSEVDSAFASMNSAGFTISQAGTVTSPLVTPADFENLAMFLKSATPAARLAFAEVVAAVSYIVNGAQFPIARPASLGIG